MAQNSAADEMKRTTVLKTVVLPLPAREIVALGRSYFTEHGYRALPSGSANSLMVRGGREGGLPSVIGEVSVQEKQSVKGRTSVVRIFRVVVFPAPFGPSRPKIDPGATLKLRLSTAFTGARPRRA